MRLDPVSVTVDSAECQRMESKQQGNNFHKKIKKFLFGRTLSLTRLVKFPAKAMSIDKSTELELLELLYGLLDPPCHQFKQIHIFLAEQRINYLTPLLLNSILPRDFLAKASRG